MARQYRTKRKLEEAKFFLDQLAANFNKLKKFDFYLSAYISSARSVLWVMRSEFHGVAGWEKWYESRKPDKEEEALLKGTNDVRIRTEKVEPLQTARIIVVYGVSDEDSERLRASLSKSQDKAVSFQLRGTSGSYEVATTIGAERHVYSATEVTFDRQLDEFRGKNIQHICHRYYETIAALVSESCERFDA